MREILFSALVLLAVPLGVFAQSIVINEIAWMGSMVDGVDPSQYWRYEWLELYNNADTIGMLDGWMLELYRDTLDFRIPLRDAISPRGYFLIGASDKIPNIDLNYKNLAGKFNNSGQKVVLKNALGEVVDEVDAKVGWPAGDNETKRTIERLQGSDPCIQGSEPCTRWQTSKDAGGTPKAQNSSGFTKNLEWEYPGDRSYIPVLQQETKKDPDRSPRPQGRGSPASPSESEAGPLAVFFIAVPGAVLAGALALAARRFLLKRV